MPPRGSASCCLLLVVIVACAVMADGTRAPPGDGCRLQPAERGVGVNVDCSDLRLDYLPNDLLTDIRRLTMRRNNITRLNDYLFEKYTQLTSLDLSHNDLHALCVSAFSGLSRLQVLDFIYHKLWIQNNTYTVGMTLLRRLMITSHPNNTLHTKYTDDTLECLSNLEFLALTGISNSQLGEGFGPHTKLKSQIAGHVCNMSVRNVTFYNWRNVNLSHLCPLFHLKTLSLACNLAVDFFRVQVNLSGNYGVQTTPTSQINTNLPLVFRITVLVVVVASAILAVVVLRRRGSCIYLGNVRRQLPRPADDEKLDRPTGPREFVDDADPVPDLQTDQLYIRWPNSRRSPVNSRKRYNRTNNPRSGTRLTVHDQ
ncbi:hypothetical protein LSAT2_021028, partial [Lamellibrachia satsuma]